MARAEGLEIHETPKSLDQIVVTQDDQGTISDLPGQGIGDGPEEPGEILVLACGRLVAMTVPGRPGGIGMLLPLLFSVDEPVHIIERGWEIDVELVDVVPSPEEQTDNIPGEHENRDTRHTHPGYQMANVKHLPNVSERLDTDRDRHGNDFPFVVDEYTETC